MENGFLWKSMETFLWNSMEITKDISMEFHGSAWRDFCGISWNVSMEFHGNRVLLLHGNAWTNFLRIPWKFSMEFHGNQCPNPPWNSMKDFPWNSRYFTREIKLFCVQRTKHYLSPNHFHRYLEVAKESLDVLKTVE